MYDKTEQTIKYAARGRHPDTNVPIMCYVGWSPDLDYWFEDGDGHTTSGFRYLPDMYLLARRWRAVDLALFQALRRAEVDWWIASNPGTAATAELEALNAGRRPAVIA